MNGRAFCPLQIRRTAFFCSLFNCALIHFKGNGLKIASVRNSFIGKSLSSILASTLDNASRPERQQRIMQSIPIQPWRNSIDFVIKFTITILKRFLVNNNLDPFKIFL